MEHMNILYILKKIFKYLFSVVNNSRTIEKTMVFIKKKMLNNALLISDYSLLMSLSAGDKPLTGLAFGTSKAKSVSQSCPTPCDPMDCSPQGSSVYGILQARILEWVAISFSRGSSQVWDKYVAWIFGPLKGCESKMSFNFKTVCAFSYMHIFKVTLSFRTFHVS